MSKFTDLLADQGAEKRFLIVAEPFDPASSTVKTIYLSSHGFNSRSADTPADQHYEARIKRAYSFERQLFSGGKVSGRTVPGNGEVVLANNDGGLDYLSGYAWGGRRIRIWVGGEDFLLSEYGKIFHGTAQGISWSDGEIILDLRSLEVVFDREIQTQEFLGTGGLQGTAEFTDRLRPRGYGIMRSVEPIYLGVVGGEQVFSLGDSGGITHVDSVRDRGVLLTYSPGTSMVPGEYTYDLDASTLTLGGSFEGPITVTLVGKPVLTVDATNSVTTGTGNKVFTVPAGLHLRPGMYVHVSLNKGNWMGGRVSAYSGTSLTVAVVDTRGSTTSSSWKIQPYGTPAQVMRKIATDMGVTSINDTAIMAYEDLVSGIHEEIGYWLPGGGNGLEIMDAIADGTGSYWGFNRAGEFTLGALGIIGQNTGVYDAPLPTVSYTSHEIIEIEREPTEDPNWSITVRYKRLWRPHSTGDLAGTVTNKERFIEEYQNSTWKDDSILGVYPLSKAITLDSVYDGSDTPSLNAAITERERQRKLFSVRRDYFRVTLKGQPLVLDLGHTVKITHPRYGLSGGKNLFVVDMKERMDGESYETELGLWG